MFHLIYFLFDLNIVIFAIVSWSRHNISFLYSEDYFCSTGLCYKQIRKPAYNIIFYTHVHGTCFNVWLYELTTGATIINVDGDGKKSSPVIRQTAVKFYHWVFLIPGLETCHSTAATYHFYMPVQELSPLTACILGLHINQISLQANEFFNFHFHMARSILIGL